MESEKQIVNKSPEKKVIKNFINQIPEEIMNNENLNEAIKILPAHYNFEIHKTIWRLQDLKTILKKDNLLVTLQFPEGLMLFACLISDILKEFTGSEFIIMGDVTYGACCIDDLTSKSLGCDFMIHYGHSCLVPINETCLKTLYVFVEINIDMDHFIQTIEINFPNKNQKYYLMGTIQFNSVMQETKQKMKNLNYIDVIIPQERPRAIGEVLGCTAPQLEVEQGQDNIIIFLCDGRFHMEGTMIQNPLFKYFQYSPYSKELTIEEYDHEMMLRIRLQEIKKSQVQIQKVGIIMGTLGRQGNSRILQRIKTNLIVKNIEYFVLLVSEVNFQQLELVSDQVSFFVQIACPRLSVDWGSNYRLPLLNPYEFFVAIEQTTWQPVYPMDYYSNKGGEWTNYFHKNIGEKKVKAKVQVEFDK